MTFSYIGRALTAPEFADYVAGYDFGSIPPSFVVLHHTANPDASWAQASGDSSTWWDRNEAGMPVGDIMTKRKRQLDSIMAYYRDSLGWSTGPHLFIDERWVWLFTPMYDVGTHAAAGNAYQDASGLHYSIGVEVVGDYTRSTWPAAIEALLAQAIQLLRARLQTFTIVYHSAPVNRPDLHDHSISLHRDYNKPACPGDALSVEYMIGVLKRTTPTSYTRYTVLAPCAVMQAPVPDSPLAEGPCNGMTWLWPGRVINVGDADEGWLWIAPNDTDPPGIGFIPQAYARKNA